MRDSALAPKSQQELADLLADASHSALQLVPWGAGFHQHLGAAPQPHARRLELAGLAQIVEYVPADLTITVEGGVPLDAIQRLLRQHEQWLAWDAPGASHATVGGLLAAGRSGPLRLAYGTPRDWVLGMRVALADGRLVRSGARVVKNVAGYDMHKLHIGALGTLGVIAEVTFKIAPLPAAFVTLGVAAHTMHAALDVAMRLRQAPLQPSSLAVLDAAAARASMPGLQPQTTLVLVRYAGARAAIERQERLVRDRLAGFGTQVLAGERGESGEAAELWNAVAEFAQPVAHSVTLRAGAPMAALDLVMAALQRHAPAGAQVICYAGVGLAYARWLQADDNVASLTRALAALREQLGAVHGYAVVEAAPAALRGSLDLWGPAPATLPIMLALKRSWDPQGILNTGRYLGGL